MDKDKEKIAVRTEILKSGLVKATVKNLQNGCIAAGLGWTKAEAIEKGYQRTL